MFQNTAGDIVFVDLPSEGDEVAQGEVCGKIQSSKWIGKLYAPLSGEVIEINEDLSDDPALINKDPYGTGWMIVIEPSDLENNLGNLMKGEAVRPWIDSEIRRAAELKKKPEGG
jgi:glycine cleavage system H protein